MVAAGSFHGISIFTGAKRLGLQIAETLRAGSIDLIDNIDAGLVYDIDKLRNSTKLGQVTAIEQYFKHAFSIPMDVVDLT